MKTSKKNIILEIGCGEGENMNFLSQQKQNQVIGIELSQELIKIAKKRYPHLQIKKMNAEDLKFKSKQFDEVYALEVLEHVDNLEAVIKGIKRVLIPGGKLTLSVPFEKSEYLLLKIRPSYFREIHHVRIFKEDELERLMKKHGFKLVTKKRTDFLGHVNVVYQFLTVKKSSNQLSIGNWRDNFFSRVVFISVSFFQPYILKTPGKYIPVWIITLPIGAVINFIGNKVLPKSLYYEFTSKL